MALLLFQGFPQQEEYDSKHNYETENHSILTDVHIFQFTQTIVETYGISFLW